MQALLIPMHLLVEFIFLDDSFCGVHIIKDPKNEVKLKEIIGRGGFGEVWKGQWRGTPVAVKLLNREGSQDSEVEQEVAIHKYAISSSLPTSYDIIVLMTALRGIVVFIRSREG